MASCDDDFPLLGDDNATPTATTANANPNFHHHHHHQAFSSHRFKASQIHAPPIHGSSPKDISGEDDVVSPEGEGYSDGGAFCSQPDPKDSNSSSYHVVGMNPYENDSNPYETEPDPSRSRASAANGKRAEQEDISENGTPYSYKKSKLNSSVASSGGGGSGEYRKDREEWSDTAIACLLEAYTEKFMQLNRGNLRGRDWEEVAAMVSDRCEKQTKSVEQCKNKVDNLKKRYKLERHRMSNSGISASHWPWFKQMEQIVGNSLLAKAVVEEEKSGNLARPAKRFGTPIAGPGGQINNMKLKSSGGPRWRRVIFKISGAALAGTTQNNIDPKVAMLIAREISIACRVGVEVAVVVGGRNFFCGDSWVTSTGLDRCTAYQIGMMATLMNSMLLQSALEKLGVQTRLQSAFSMPEVAEPYNRQRAIRHLEKGRVVIFGGIGAGTGISLFTTDTAAALRASEIHADAMLKGTNVEGVYVCDSRSNNLAAEHISFTEAHLVTNAIAKSVWVIFQLFFYALRPLFLKPKPPGVWEFINLTVQLALDAALVYFFGWKSFAYLILSTFVGGGMHPMAGHFISEHYVFNPEQETYSYYGPLNLMTWSVGYHNEHHDFPRIPGSKLYKVKEIAPEYYDTLDSYTSWSQVIYMYVMDCTVGPFSRMKRKLADMREKKSE